MILYPSESIVAQGGAALLGTGTHLTGTFSVTSHRLVFESGGQFPHTVMEVEIGRVWNVHVGGERGGFLKAPREFLTVEAGHGRWVFELANARGWADAIVRTKGTLPQPPPPPPPSPGVASPPSHLPGQPVVINVAAPAAPKVMMSCRYCGALFDAANGRCDKCGARPT